jgi:type I restriction enzyme R subunit
VGLRREFAGENGADTNLALPKTSPVNPQFRTKTTTDFEKVSSFVEKLRGLGGNCRRPGFVAHYDEYAALIEI